VRLPIEGSGRKGLLTRGLTRIAAAIRFDVRHLTRPSLPLAGYTEHRHEIAHVDPLSDEDLSRLNQLLQWKAFTVDRHGRRFGGAAWAGKRDRAQEVPDRRILLLNDRFALADKRVLEFGCFEGIHTVGLCQFAREVTAVDGRMENVTKTIVRAAFYGYHPIVFQHDVEKASERIDLLRADVLHHVGVLYHLRDPVRHLLELGRYIRSGVMLDSHYALPEEATFSYAVNGKEYPYKRFQERGLGDVFSGLHPHSKWLPLDVITGLLKESGFSKVEVVETRRERNGPRVLLFASRP
jgi:2-polyprenyl-3-methyl-5-hydroxy-6-metoxy-1,4-benzoquinol methylase